MAFELLTAEARHLQSIGLSFLLMPGACPLSPAAEPAARDPSRSVHVRPAPEDGQRPRQSWRPKPAAPAERPAENPARVSAAAPRPEPAIQPRETKDGPAWPREWEELFRRIKPGELAWTYYGLGEDLAGTPKAVRRGRLQELLASLNLPAGTNTFWPPGLPARDENGRPVLRMRPDLFWDGLNRLGARLLIVMGSRGARAIGIEGEIKPRTILNRSGVRVFITWDIDFLDTPEKMAAAKTYLQMLRRFV